MEPIITNPTTPQQAAQFMQQNEDSVGTGVVPTITNVVAQASVGRRLDLKMIALKAMNCEYNPRRFAGAIIRIREPQSTCVLFASGKMLVTGAKSEDDAKLAARKYVRIVQKILGKDAQDPPVQFEDYRIINICACADYKFRIRLEQFTLRHHNFAKYEPELFPAVVYHMMRPKLCVMIFGTGKVVFSGAKKREDIYTGSDLMYPAVKEYRVTVR